MMRRLHRRDRRVINAKRAFDIKDQYRPADLNPYARDREFARERERESEEIHSRLPMEGVEFDYTDAQVRAAIPVGLTAHICVGARCQMQLVCYMYARMRGRALRLLSVCIH